MDWTITYKEDGSQTIEPIPFNPQNGDLIKHVYPETSTFPIKELTMVWKDKWDKPVNPPENAVEHFNYAEQ